MAPYKDDERLGLALRFEVMIDKWDLGSWSKCTGLDVSFDICQYQEGNRPDFTWYFPGNTKYSHITLTRASTQKSTKSVMAWLSEMQTKPEFGTGKITLKNAWTEEVAHWDLKRVLPAKWTGPSFDANGSVVATETLELVHEGFLES
jgi:phage tail-like protein